MRVVIAGVTGLVGSYVASRFIEDRWQVYGLTRNPEKVRNPVSGVQYLLWDGTGNSWSGLVDSETVIINLIGESIFGIRWTSSKKKRIVESRVSASQLIFKIAEEYKPKLVIQASAVGYYGNTGGRTIDEKSLVGDDFLSKVCEDWEAAAKDYSGRYVIFRLGAVLSSSGGILKTMSLPFKLFVGGRIGSGNQFLSWIHIADVYRAMSFVIQDDSTGGVYNIVAPNPITNKEMSKLLGQKLRRPNFFVTPVFLLKILLGEMSLLVLYSQKVIPQRLLEAGFKFKFPTLGEALSDLIKK